MRSAGEKQGEKQISDPLDNYPVGVYNPYRIKHTPAGYFGRLRYGWNDESVLRFGAAAFFFPVRSNYRAIGVAPGVPLGSYLMTHFGLAKMSH